MDTKNCSVKTDIIGFNNYPGGIFFSIKIPHGLYRHKNTQNAGIIFLQKKQLLNGNTPQIVISIIIFKPMDEPIKYRITSIDILRGLVMVIMALDHTRDFFHKTAMTEDPLSLATTTVPLYFTRWITHFCAPAFVFLSGISAFLSAKNKSPKNAGKFLIKRGFWLIFAELAIVTLGLTFNPIYSVLILQVIWAIGWSMVLLGVFIRFKLHVIFITGMVLFFGHNLLDTVALPPTGFVTILMKVLFTAQGTVLPLSNTHFVGVFYTILPWTGVMFLLLRRQMVWQRVPAI